MRLNPVFFAAAAAMKPSSGLDPPARHASAKSKGALWFATR